MNIHQLLITAATLAACATGTYASANSPEQTAPEQTAEEKILQSKENLEDLLSHKEKINDLSAFLHTAIDKDAAIMVQTIEPGAGNAAPKTIELSKTDYINSYVYGPRAIKDYRVDIQITDFEFDAQNNVVKTHEVMTESGTKLDPWNYKAPGVQFTSKTKCTSSYSLKTQTPKLSGSDCKVVILQEENA